MQAFLVIYETDNLEIFCKYETGKTRIETFETASPKKQSILENYQSELTYDEQIYHKLFGYRIASVYCNEVIKIHAYTTGRSENSLVTPKFNCHNASVVRIYPEFLKDDNFLELIAKCLEKKYRCVCCSTHIALFPPICDDVSGPWTRCAPSTRIHATNAS
jgi:hypothetical protein